MVLNRLGVDGAMHAAARAVRKLAPRALVTLGGGPEQLRWVRSVQRLRVDPASGKLSMEDLGQAEVLALEQALRAEMRRGVQIDSLVSRISFDKRE